MSRAKQGHHHEADPDYIKWTADKKKCIFSPRGLNIVWGNEPRYWILPKNGSQPAELVSACRLEITGSVEVEKCKTYRIGFHVSFTPDAVGWADAPVMVCAKIGKKGKSNWKRVRSVNPNVAKGKVIMVPSASDGALEVTVAADGGACNTTLHFGMYEVWGGKWKGGLLLYEAFVQQVD